LSKAFNVPIAVLSGSRASITRFRDASASRLYCGPPSIPNALAAMRAVTLNAHIGDRLRAALWRRIALFRAACGALGVTLGVGKLPVQTVVNATSDVATLVSRLADLGLRAFASRGHHDDAPHLRLVITASHQPSELWQAARLLRDVLRMSMRDKGVTANAAVL
jgi:8-amino-7-oxononanoate synthase